jgi:anti-sigma-K factor RsiG
MRERTEASSVRNAEVLDPTFVEGLQQLPLDELRRRRDEALAEREYLSYLRRLLQVREDVLRTELSRRQHGGEPEDLMDRLTRVLSEGPRARGRGEALRITLAEDDMAEAERRADEAVGTSWSPHSETLDDVQLDESLAALEREERAVSESRAAIFRVHDQLQEELKRRYQENPSQIGPV